MDNIFINNGKKEIESFNIIGLQNLYKNVINYHIKSKLSLKYIYKELFLYACQYNFLIAIVLFFDIFQLMDRVHQSSLRELI